MKIPINAKFYFKLLLAILLLVLISFGIYYFYKQNNNLDDKNKTKQTEQNENLALLEKVSRLILLPNEQAIIATINDSENINKGNLFYQNAKDGDKLIMFPNSKKAIIYRLSEDVIVNSGPFVINNTNEIKR